MQEFEHVNALTAEEAVGWLKTEGQSRAIAGGIDLLALMKLEVLRPSRLVNLKTLPGAARIEFSPQNGLKIGALATLSEIGRAQVVGEHYPALAQAISLAASPQLRNTGTLGGNLLQNSRCWYYRGPFDCWLKGGVRCYARDGENKLHAIFGQGACHSVQPSDTATVLWALNARVAIYGPAGKRVLPIAEFFQEPTQDARRYTRLAADEIVTDILVPPPQANSRDVYLKAMERRVWSFAMASVAAHLTFKNKTIQEARLVLGGVASLPWELKETAEILRGEPIRASLINKAADLAVSGAHPLAHNGYKVALVKGLVSQALSELKR